MNCLLYLLFCGVKNSLRETIHKPARLFMYLFVIFLIGASFASNALMTRDPAELKDIHLLGGMFFAFITPLLLLSLSRAFKSGGSLFQMSDVNLLFVSPVSPQKILIYGVIQVIKTAFVAGLFILFQGSTLGWMFGAGQLSLLLILIIFALSLCLSEIITILIYGVTNGNPLRKRIAKVAVAFVFLPLAATAFIAFTREGDAMNALLYICKSSAFQMTPVSGWGAAALVALLKGEWLSGGLFLALIGCSITGLFVVLFRLKSDYYEDVLVATESLFEKRRAIAEGNIGLASATEKKIRIAKTGLKGCGAQVLFGKHLRETFRGSRFGLINSRTILYTAAAAVFAFIKRDAPGNNLLIILQIFAWIQIFAIGLEPSLREFFTHYIYLIPEPPFKKLVWNSLSIVLKTGVDAILIFLVAGVILGENPFVIAGAIITCAMFALLLVGINILSLRLTSVDISTGILVMIYVFSVIIVMLPVLIPAFILAAIINGKAGIVAALGVVSLWEMFVSFVCFALSRGILNDCDMPVVKIGN